MFILQSLSLTTEYFHKVVTLDFDSILFINGLFVEQEASDSCVALFTELEQACDSIHPNYITMAKTMSSCMGV